MSGPDIVLRGGRVIDPESGLDAIQDVAVTDGQVTQIGNALPRAQADLDVAGRVVTAGFIDLHSHVNDIAGFRCRPWMASPPRLSWKQASPRWKPRTGARRPRAGRQLRLRHVLGAGPDGGHRRDRLDGRLATFLANLASEAWQRPATAPQITAMLARLSADLADGALGIGVLVGYAPATDPDEYLQVAGLAAEAGVPTFTHARDLVELVPRTRIDGAGRSSARPGRPAPRCTTVTSTAPRSGTSTGSCAWSAGRRPRGAGHHRGLPVRVRHDRYRGRLPRPGAARRARAHAVVADLRADRRAGRRRGPAARVAAAPIPGGW